MATSVEKVEACAVIRFLHLQGKSAREIHDQMTPVYQEGVPSYGKVVRWKRRFHCEQTNIEDEPQSGRPSLAEDPGIVAQVEALILSDRRITIEAIVHEIRIGHGSVFNIIHDKLHMTKVAAHWVPRLLNPVQKRQWMDVCKHAGSPPPKKAKPQLSSGKVMLSVFCDWRGVIMTDYAQKGITITGEYYWDLLRKLWEEIKKK
ncbi:protein GVQW3-like [Cryptotermes secundus]|uniref:protein GVQW3-like n=1 Tax=Cryptotermes secundus TaxID=105785 RepID=UPI000CD7B997|nr:protein GVQW3-like [Cryptotermes secundus]